MSESFFGNFEFYEHRASAYDAMLGSSVYNKLCWGTSPADYSAFAAQAIGSGSGPMLEVAVGTARATAVLHVASRRETTLLDMNEAMLALAKKSVRVAGGRVIPGHIDFECRDMLSPHTPQTYETILGLGLLHLVPELATLFSGLGAQLQDHGSLYLASLIKGSKRSNAYLKLLKSHGDIAALRTASEIYEQAIDARLGSVTVKHKGAMAYLVIRR